ncbi:MAG: DUF2971 domain-containing protein [Bacteroidota bacterium]
MDNSDTTLYHYCSSEAFVSIVTSRTIWLSSLALSNDSKEGRLVRETLLRLAARDGLPVTDQTRLEDSLAFAERVFDGLGFCLSEAGDLLSQWRGYADDGRGVAIGFSKLYLTKLGEQFRAQEEAGFNLYKVEYNQAEQEASITPAYRKLRSLIDDGAFRRQGQWSLLDDRTSEQIAAEDKETSKLYRSLLLQLISLFPKLYELKAEGFKEEREWRLVHLKTELPNGDYKFRSKADSVIPYKCFELPDLGCEAIREVIIGPKHSTPPQVLQYMLKQSGFGEVPTRESSVSYR